MQGHHWARNFTVDKEDIDYLTGLLLENETPLNTDALATAIISEKLAQEADVLRQQYQDSRIYNPSDTYESGQKLIFPVFNYATAVVKNVRSGTNPDYEPFEVITVEFEDESLNRPGQHREFAASLTTHHTLSNTNSEDIMLELGSVDTSVEDILAAASDDIIYTLENALAANDSLIQVAGKWFPSELLVEVNEGHLNLTEAVLDISGGGPLSTEAILAEIGGLGSGSPELQVFSLNHALRDDSRFDEVGPAGEVLWYLRRLEPEAVRQIPPMLVYTPIPYEASLLTADMRELEAEIDDEFSDLSVGSNMADQATITLSYPHRRTGTLPLSARLKRIFPTARQTPRVFVILVDGQDGEEYPGWVVRENRYIFGLDTFFRKHRLPVGAYVTVSKADDPDKVVVNFNAYRPRTEWIRLITPKNNQISFENHKRSIGAEYDDLMILGADDLAAVDALFENNQKQRRPLVAILRSIIPSLGRLTPQGTAHAKTIYSAVNTVKRCPPGPIFATLVANPDFQNVGGHYWKLSDDQER
jgi:hypothetical protein